MLYVGEVGGLDGAEKKLVKVTRKKRERNKGDVKVLSDQACWREGAEEESLPVRKLRVDVLP